MVFRSCIDPTAPRAGTCELFTLAAILAPEHGQHTEEILIELCYSWEEIEVSRKAEAI